MHVETETLPGLRLATLRHLGPYQQIGRTFGRMHEIATRAGLPHRELVGVYYDNPTITPGAASVRPQRDHRRGGAAAAGARRAAGAGRPLRAGRIRRNGPPDCRAPGASSSAQSPSRRATRTRAATPSSSIATRPGT